MNFDKFLELLFGKKTLTAACILALCLFCLAACTPEDAISCMFCGVPTCKTMEDCSNSIASCQSNCKEQINQAICDATCNGLLCYTECAEDNCYNTDCSSPAECMAGCMKGCFVDENGKETDCGAAGGDCDDCFTD